MLEVLSEQRALVYWFSFDPEGNRRWFFGIGRIEEDKMRFNNLITTQGGVFGAGFNRVGREDTLGRMELELDCEAGTARFAPIEEGFPAGTLDVVRLTVLDGFGC